MLPKFKLFFSYLRCMSLLRFGNFLLLKSSFLVSKLTNRTVFWGKAWGVSFETVSGCNLQCPGCEQGAGMLDRDVGLMDVEKYFVALNKLPSTVFHVNLHFQGEPLLHPKIAKFVRLARQKRIFVSLSTNAQLLDESTAKELITAKLSHIIISLDGYDNDSYTKYRVGGDFETVVSNIRCLTRLKKSAKKSYPIVEVQAVAMSHNENQLDKIKNIAFSSGADIFKVKTAYVPDLRKAPDYFPEQEKYRRYQVMPDGFLKTKRNTPRFCFRAYGSCVVMNDLRVVPCCFDKQGSVVLGNLETDDFSDIHKGAVGKGFHHNLRKGNPPQMCMNCV